MDRADKDLAFLLQYENIAWYENGKVRILDRRYYPLRTEYVICNDYEDVVNAIKDMVTQSGGPYIAAKLGLALAAYTARNRPKNEQIEYLEKAAFALSHARPTTVMRMANTMDGCLIVAKDALTKGLPIDQAIFEYAIEDLNARYLMVSKIANNLVDKFPNDGTVMTQCFAETLIGFMLKKASEKGKKIKIICPETRPYLQGSRLTASVVLDQGFNVTVITDNMPGYVLKEKKVDLFTSGADVICMDGYIVNKIGTFQIALCAHYWGIPYFVTGQPIKYHDKKDTVIIEERDPDSVLQVMGIRIAKEGVNGFYPAFDITPPKLISGIVTEKGIFSPYNLESYFEE